MTNATVSASDRTLRLAGSDQLIDRLVRRHGQALFRFLLRLTHGDLNRTEEIYQETLIRAWRHPEACRGCLTNGPNWLFTVARHISIDQLRAASIRPTLVHDEHDLTDVADPADDVSQLLLAGEVRAAIQTLSASHREVLRQIYFEDRPAAEVADRLGIPLGTVKSRAYYALRALKDALAQQGLDRFVAQSA